MRPLEFTLGFLLLLSLAGQLFGGPPSSGPYWVTMILWILGTWLREFIALFGVHVSQIMSFSTLSTLIFVIWLIGGLFLFLGGWLGDSNMRKVGT